MVWHRFDGMFAPLREALKMQQEFQRAFGVVGEDLRTARYPRINLVATDEGLTLTGELPGVSADSLDLSVEGSTLTLRGERPDLAGEDTIVRRERRVGAFHREVELPYEVDATTVEARFDNGVLEVSLPRPAAAQPLKIPVREAARQIEAQGD